MTRLKFYNTLTRQKERFEPENAKNVRMYVCGPTVYDYAHIGNARPVIVFDVVFRLLRHLYGEDHVTYVRNITDVDDKINARALRDYPGFPLNEAIRNVTAKTTDQFHADVKALGCLVPSCEPRATEHIEDMVAMIQTLLDKGHAYVATGDQGREVLFRVMSMDDYGQLSNRKPGDQLPGARVAMEAHKENSGDFVLWKESSENEPGWPGMFKSGAIHGRPGWHIECSVMSRHHLGETFDIHGGGLDLIFPHHENEMAQSCCAHGTNGMARYWMHNGYLQVEGRKMSKSEGNFVTIHDLLNTAKFGDRKWSGEVLRIAMLMSPYREPIDFSVKRLVEAENILEKWSRLISANANWKTGSEYRQAWEDTTIIRNDVMENLFDDLNTPAFIQAIGRLVEEHDPESARQAFAICRNFGLMRFEHIQSLTIEEAVAKLSLDEADISRLVSKRLEVLKAGDFVQADCIRDELGSQGIRLRDSKDSETGERITNWEVLQ